MTKKNYLLFSLVITESLVPNERGTTVLIGLV